MRFGANRVTAWGVCAALLFSIAFAAQTRPEDPRPKLVVVLVVDQMRADYVDKFRQQWTGGLRRLLKRGAWFRQAAYPYLNTHTCAGHATVSTGTFPRTHGIVQNAWFERAAGKQTACTDDPQSQVISYGLAAKGGYSAANLGVPTFSDELRTQSSVATRVAALSLKARSAIMLAGHRADAVTWFDSTIGAWETSAAYAASPVPLVEKFVKAHAVENDLGKTWTESLPPEAYLYQDTARREKQTASSTSSSLGVLRGKRNKPDAAFYEAWEASPFSDAYLGEMAQAAVDELGLGKGPGTDFLGVSFSALDLVGHAQGPRSAAVQDLLVRLDATIGALLEHLDRAVGPDNYVVALTADHGVAPIPEQMAREGFDAGRIPPKEVVDRVEKALVPFFGSGKKVARMAGNDFYFAPGLYEKLAANPAAIGAVIHAILAVPGVSQVFRSEELREQPATDDPIRRAAALSYFPGRSGDLVIVPKAYWFFAEESVALATTHGTAYGYDARVPVLLMGRGIRPGEYLTPATPADIAPTLAFLCGITLARSDGRVLAEALAAPAASLAEASPHGR